MPSYSFSESCSGWNCVFCGPIDEFASERRPVYVPLPPSELGTWCRCCAEKCNTKGECEACGWNPDIALAEHTPTCPGALPF